MPITRCRSDRVCTENLIRIEPVENRLRLAAMIGLILLALNLLAALFKSKSRLEAENAALRQQLVVLRRKVHGRVRLTRGDRLFLVQLYCWFPSILKVITIVRPRR